MNNIRNELYNQLINNIGSTGSGHFPESQVADNLSKSIDNVVGTDIRELAARVQRIESYLSGMTAEKLSSQFSIRDTDD